MVDGMDEEDGSASIASLGMVPTTGFARRRRKPRRPVEEANLFNTFTYLYLGLSSAQYSPESLRRGRPILVDHDRGVYLTSNPQIARRSAEATASELQRGVPIVVILRPAFLDDSSVVVVKPDEYPEVTTEKAFRYYGSIPRKAILTVASSLRKLANFAAG